jgi:purine-binding chemotaxis protein CheW
MNADQRAVQAAMRVPDDLQARRDFVVAGHDKRSSLICRTGMVLCALPVEHVIETMRLPPLDVLPGTPHFVAGMANVRGALLPVVSTSRLLGKDEKRPERLVVARVGQRRVGLAVDAVIGVRALSGDMLQRLPPLLRDALHDAVADIGTLDGELLVVLQAARVVPAEVFAMVEAEATAS